jgi:hypothetical protein
MAVKSQSAYFSFWQVKNLVKRRLIDFIGAVIHKGMTTGSVSTRVGFCAVLARVGLQNTLRTLTNVIVRVNVVVNSVNVTKK